MREPLQRNVGRNMTRDGPSSMTVEDANGIVPRRVASGASVEHPKRDRKR